MATPMIADQDRRFDVVVIGGGAAGLSGALALARARRAVLVIDSGTPRNAAAGHVHNYLTRDGTPPAELLALGRAEVVRYGGQVTTGHVSTVERLDNGDFEIALADDNSVRARRLLIATGSVDALPDIPGVAERWGRDVIHCPYCHGWEVQDRAIGILGTGPMAAHGALLFRQWSDNIVLFQHTAPPLSEEQAEQLAARGIRVVDGEVAALEIHADRLVGIRMQSDVVVPCQALAVTSHVDARAAMLHKLGLEVTEQRMGDYVFGSAITADATGATSVPGVWVAGNVTDPMAQVITSAAVGLKTGAMINADLIAEETAAAVAAFRARTVATQDQLVGSTNL